MPTRPHTETAIDAILQTVTQAPARSETIQLAGFGSCSPRAHAERDGRNSST
ncbi:HU family DNA-binding protein [Burkholderia ambifaria]|uniref:HU family DNA-binding protein n=1 Tax=Burkholderia ambifaria TaxID=152480 RepID=UPI0039F494AE